MSSFFLRSREYKRRFLKKWLITVKSPSIEMDFEDADICNTIAYIFCLDFFFLILVGCRPTVFFDTICGDNTDAVTFYLVWLWYYSSQNRRFED